MSISEGLTLVDVRFGLFNGDKRKETGEDATEVVDSVRNKLVNDPLDLVELYSGEALQQVYLDESSNIVFGLRINGIGVENVFDYEEDMTSGDYSELFGDSFEALVRLLWCEYERIRRETPYNVDRFDWFDVVWARVALAVTFHSDSGSFYDPPDEWIDFEGVGIVDFSKIGWTREGDRASKVTGVKIGFVEYPDSFSDLCPIYKVTK